MAKEEKNKPKPCPKWLNDVAKKEWRRVAKIFAAEGKEFTDKDLKALEAYCINYAKWQKCEQIIDEKGYSMEVGDNGYEQQRPEVSIANKAQTELRAWAKELGLTPAARQRMREVGNMSDNGIDPELDGMVAHTLLILYESIEQEVTWSALTKEKREKGYKARFNTNVILRTDAKTQQEILCGYTTAGIYKPNESRLELQRETVPEGNDLVVNAGVLKLKDLGKNTEGE